jgi:cephalosporin hydroxylase
MSSLREFVKSKLTDQQRKRVRRAIDSVKSIYVKPHRAIRRAGIERRLPSLPHGRQWRSAMPATLRMSFRTGVINYRHRGIPMLKHPVEVALYMRLIWETNIIEIGSHSGGAAVWMADMLHVFGIKGSVVSIDLRPPTPPYAPSNVTFLHGDTNDVGATLTPTLLRTLPRPCLIIEDSRHQYQATLAILRFFDSLLQRGKYIVIEDAGVTEMGEDARFDGGPARAIVEFMLDQGRDYESDADYCDHFGSNVTGNPNGYLRRR